MKFVLIPDSFKGTLSSEPVSYTHLELKQPAFL